MALSVFLPCQGRARRASSHPVSPQRCGTTSATSVDRPSSSGSTSLSTRCATPEPSLCSKCGPVPPRGHTGPCTLAHLPLSPRCEVCGFQCRQRASLKYHMTKHKAETELDFACDQCGRRFEKAHNLNVHMSMVHPLTQTQDKARPLEPPPGTTEGQAVKPEPT